MSIKLNNKPIKIEEVPEKTHTIPYLIVSGMGIFLMLWIVDLLAYNIFWIHPFKFTVWLTNLFNWLGGF